MRKFLKMLSLTMMLLVCLTGCSNQNDITGAITVELKDGTILVDGADVGLLTYNGSTAIGSSPLGFGCDFSLDNVTMLDYLAVNDQGVQEVNMNTFKGCKWYTSYLGSRYTVVKNLSGDDKLVAVLSTGDTAVGSEVIVDWAAKALKSMHLTNGPVYCKVGAVTVGNENYELKVTKEAAAISGIVKVTEGESTYATGTTTLTNGKKTYEVAYGTVDNWDFYTYEGTTIQILSGLDVFEYCQFK